MIIDELATKDVSDVIKKIKSLKIEENQSIRIFKDTNKITLLVDNNVDKNQDEILNIFKEYCEELPNIEYIKYLKPIHTDFEKNAKLEVVDLKQKIVKYNKNMVLPKMMPYSGRTPSDALKKDGINALVAICSKEHLMDPQIYKGTLKCIEVTFREFLEKEYSNIEVEDVDLSEVKNFILTIEQILPESVDRILNKATFNSIESLVKYGDELTLRSAYASLIKSLIQKFK